jgi:catechol 2,3-dioxygenase-like lactoylglutathione lyase family enzyme
MKSAATSALVRFEHVNMSCKDLEATRDFYQKVFPDWYVRAEGINEYGERWIHFGNDHFYLALSHTPNHSRTHHLYENIGINHVGFVIHDGEAMKAQLDQNGIKYSITPAAETKYRIYITDPNGNETELVEYHQDYRLK